MSSETGLPAGIRVKPACVTVGTGNGAAGPVLRKSELQQTDGGWGGRGRGGAQDRLRHGPWKQGRQTLVCLTVNIHGTSACRCRASPRGQPSPAWSPPGPPYWGTSGARDGGVLAGWRRWARDQVQGATRLRPAAQTQITFKST